MSSIFKYSDRLNSRNLTDTVFSTSTVQKAPQAFNLTFYTYYLDIADCLLYDLSNRGLHRSLIDYSVHGGVFAKQHNKEMKCETCHTIKAVKISDLFK